MSKKWINLGSLRRDAKGNHNLILNKNVEITVDGEAVDLGEFRLAKAFNTIDRLNGLLEKGKITQADFEKRLAYIEDKNIRLDIVIPPQD